MNQMKRILSFCLALALIAACLPVLGQTADAATVNSGTCGENLTWTLDDEGTLTISGTGAMENYLYESLVPWNSVSEQIKTVIIESGVTTIGDAAFHECYSLTSVTIPDSVTTIGDRVFFYCDSLTSVTIPDSATTIGDEAFYGCDSLTSVTIGDSVTTIGDDAFYRCDSLTAINVGSGNAVYKSINGVLFNKAGTTLLQCPGGKSGAYKIPKEPLI